MAFDWTLIKTDSLIDNNDRQYWGYNVGSSGMVLNIRLRMAVPGAVASLSPTKGLEKEVYLPGDSVSSLNPVWTQLKDEDLGNRLHRYEHAYQTPGGNVLLRNLTTAQIYIRNTLRTFYVDENYQVLIGAQLSGTDITGGGFGNVINKYLSTTQPSGMTTAAEVVYQFDGTGSQLNDRTANGHNTVLTVGATFNVASPNGYVGLGFRSNCRYETPYSAGLQINGSCTFEIVLTRGEGLVTQDDIFRFGMAGGGAGEEVLWGLGVLNDGRYYSGGEVSGGGDAFVFFDSFCIPGATDHIAVTRNNNATSTYKLYQNGVLIDTLTHNQPGGGGNSRIYIGTGNASANPYTGVIHCAKMTPAEFTGAQVAASYRGLL